MPTDHVLERYLAKILLKVIGVLVVLGMATFLADYAVWRIRVASGGGMDHLTVSQIEVIPMKGQKEMYYPQGLIDVACSRTVFPQSGAGACWWLHRYPEVYIRY